jgi:hypothetical protein
MDDLTKRIYDKYVEDIVASLDLQRIIEFIIYLWFLVSLSQVSKYSIWPHVLDFNFKDVFDVKGQFWSSLKIGHMLGSLVASYFTGYLYNLIKKTCFLQFSRIRNPSAYFDKLRCLILKTLTGDKEVDLALSREWAKDLPGRKRKIVRMHIGGEIMLSISIASLSSVVLKKNWLDIIVAGVFLLATVIIQWKSYLYFIEKIVPLSLPKDLLLGINSSPQELFSSSSSEE